MFTFQAIWSAHKPEIIENPETGKLSNYLCTCIALDLISAIALIIIGSLAASNIVSTAPGGSYAMIGLGCFQASPLLLGVQFAAAKDKSSANLAFNILGIIDSNRL